MVSDVLEVFADVRSLEHAAAPPHRLRVQVVQTPDVELEARESAPLASLAAGSRVKTVIKLQYMAQSTFYHPTSVNIVASDLRMVVKDDILWLDDVPLYKGQCSTLNPRMTPARLVVISEPRAVPDLQPLELLGRLCRHERLTALAKATLARKELARLGDIKMEHWDTPSFTYMDEAWGNDPTEGPEGYMLFRARALYKFTDTFFLEKDLLCPYSAVEWIAESTLRVSYSDGTSEIVTPVASTGLKCSYWAIPDVVLCANK